jgi:hypothetical protein
MRLITELPDPFLLKNGQRVASIEDWQQRREEIKDMMLNIQYGTMPGAPEAVSTTTLETETLDSGETREKLRLEFTPNKHHPNLTFGVDVTVWRPSEKAITKRKETINGFGKNGLPALIYVGDKKFETLLNNGYMMICYENNQLEPMEMGNAIVGPARTAYQELEPDAHSWGSISIWAWGGLRMLEYALSLPEVDNDQIMISGHSRNGKTALLAGALDDRIALVNPAGSGCAGAGSYLALGEKCEDLAALTSRERWWAWAHPNFEKWVGNEEELPFDQHFLMSLVAPRPLLRTEGTTDEWANPEGTCVSFLATEPIYQCLNVPDRNGIYFHEGGHTHTEEDATALVAFADAHFFQVPSTTNFKTLLRDKAEFPTAFSWANPI